MTRRRWSVLAGAMAISCIILLLNGDGLALAAAIMSGVALVKAAES